MQTRHLIVDPHHPDSAAIEAAAAVLRRGGLVAFPTETVYGLGANALDGAACAGIYTAKGRPGANPLIVHVASVAEAHQVCASWPEKAAKLAERFWPGPLTLVLPKRDCVPDIVTAGGPTVAVRVPAHPVALALLRACALPLAAPSANRSGLLSPTQGKHVLAGLAGRIDLVLDAGPTTGGVESTVLDLAHDPPRLLRPGLVTPAEIEAEIGAISCPAHLTSAEETAMPSPGMLSRHYAPRTPLECLSSGGAERVNELVDQGARAGWVTFGARAAPAGVNVIAIPTEPTAYAARLYAVLHELDAAGLTHIVLELPQDTEEWRTVRDRLRRAATTFQ